MGPVPVQGGQLSRKSSRQRRPEAGPSLKGVRAGCFPLNVVMGCWQHSDCAFVFWECIGGVSKVRTSVALSTVATTGLVGRAAWLERICTIASSTCQLQHVKQTAELPPLHWQRNSQLLRA